MILNSKRNEFKTRDDKYLMMPQKLPEGIKTFMWQVHVFSPPNPLSMWLGTRNQVAMNY